MAFIKRNFKLFFKIHMLYFAMIGVTLANQDQCSDVLLEGTKARQLYYNYEFYRQLVNWTFLKSSSETVQKDTSVTANIPLYDFVVGGTYDESKYKHYKETLRETLTMDAKSVSLTDILLESGDKEILQAWSTCMASKGGLSIRFDEIRAKKAILWVEWFGKLGLNEITLSDDIVFPQGLKVAAGQHCTKKGYIVKNGASCAVRLEMTDPKDDALVTVYSDGRGSAAAYLPARLKSEKETRAFQPGGRLKEPGCSNQGPIPFVVMSPPRRATTSSTVFCSNEGWYFDIESSAVKPYGINGYTGSLQSVHASLRHVAGTQVVIEITGSNSSENWFDAVVSPQELREMRYVTLPWDEGLPTLSQHTPIRPSAK